MSAIVLTLLAIPAAQATSSGVAVGGDLSSAVTEDNARMLTRVAGVVAGASTTRATGFVAATSVRPRSERCRSARMAVPYYRFWTHLWQTARHAPRLATQSPIVRGKSCHWARYAAQEWQARARSAKRSYERWVREHTLRETESWQAAIRVVQVVFPGTAAWMDSCSDAEGMSPSRDREFYVYGFLSFSWAAWYADTVGGPGQIRPSTFVGMYQSGLAYVLERGFLVPKHLHEANAYTWQSMLAQAIAMGWARFTGNDNQHWVASWGRGC